MFQLADGIIVDLRSLLSDIKSSENQLRQGQAALENTLQHALGIVFQIFFDNFVLKYWKYFSIYFLDPSDPDRLLRLS